MLDPETVSDEALLAAAPTDGEAFAAFYRRWEPPVLAYFHRQTRHAELAADLTAEVFAAVLLTAHRFRDGGAPAHAWLFGIARHKLAASRRRGAVEDRARRRLQMRPVALGDDDLERIDAVAGSPAAVAALLARLAPDQREAVRAHILDEEGYEEIALRLRCSPAVVRKRVSRGLATLRQSLEEEHA